MNGDHQLHICLSKLGSYVLSCAASVVEIVSIWERIDGLLHLLVVSFLVVDKWLDWDFSEEVVRVVGSGPWLGFALGWQSVAHLNSFFFRTDIRFAVFSFSFSFLRFSYKFVVVALTSQLLSKVLTFLSSFVIFSLALGTVFGRAVLRFFIFVVWVIFTIVKEFVFAATLFAAGDATLFDFFLHKVDCGDCGPQH